MIVYDRRFYAWAFWTNLNANAILAFTDKDNDGRTYLYFTEYSETTMCEFTPGVYNDKGAAIEAVFITRAFEGKALDKEKYWYTIRPIFRLTTGAVQLDFITENGTQGRTVALAPNTNGGLGNDNIGAALFGTSMVDTYTNVDLGLESADQISSETDATHTVFDVGVGVDSRTLKARFSNNEINETFSILGWVLLYQEKDTARFDGAYTIR